MKFTRTLTIDQDRWLNAQVLNAVNTDESDERLLSGLRDRKSGLQCCLGFAMRGAGTAIGNLENESLPSGVSSKECKNAAYHAELRSIEEAAADANDDSCDTEAARKKYLRKIFATIGVRLVFTGNIKNAIARAKKAYGVK